MATEKTTITSRAANFTSSAIWKLMTNDRKETGIGSPGLTYIKEKKMEAKLGRQLQKETSSRSISWGTFVQHRVTNTLLDTSCKPTKDERREHRIVSNWTGAEDYIRHGAGLGEKIAGEVKCFELKKFCQTHDAATIGAEALKVECPEIWWQLVSNAILNGTEKAELCLYVPYKKELSAIKDEADQPDVDQEHQWLKYAKDDELPYLIEGLHYPNISLFSFDIPQQDITALTNRVIMATKMLSE